MSSIWDSLDGLVGAYAQVETAKVNANAAVEAAKAQTDQTTANPISSVQATTVGGVPVLYLAAAAVLLGTLLFLRKR